MPDAGRMIANVPVQRAVGIGLGGTGGAIISILRRLIKEGFGGFDRLPIVEFLYIDTDSNWIQRLNAEAPEDICLSASQVVDITVNDASGLYEGIEKGYWPEYSWFDLPKLKGCQNIVQGAGTVRQLGRLCFWMHRSTIEQKLRNLVNQITPATTAQYMLNEWQQQVDPGINIYIIGSLAGGTGAGCFLDMAYLARKVIKDLQVNGAPQFAGYLVMPTAFRDITGANPYPNAYAALKELNYLNYIYADGNKLAPLFGQPEWRAEYTSDGANTIFERNVPPFDYCYLMDTSNGHVQLSRDEIFAMVARSIYHEFTLEFASFKRSLRANIRNRIVSNDPLDCPARFMSFGQSSVHFPAREVKQLLTHQLALNAVQRWVDLTASPIQIFTGNGDKPNTESGDEEAQFILSSITAASRNPEVQGAVREYLHREYVPGRYERQAVLTAVIADERTRLVDVPYRLRENEKQRWTAENWPREAFPGNLQSVWRDWKTNFGDDGAEPEKWGEQIRWMAGNKEKALKRYRAELHTQAMTFFQDPNRGPAYALAFATLMPMVLSKLKSVLLTEANDATAIARALGDVHLINAASQSSGPSLSTIIERRIGEEYTRLDEIVRENGFIFKVMNRQELLRTQAYEYLTWCAHWCRARVEERARRLASDICDTLISALQDIEQEILRTASFLASLQAAMARDANEWAQRGMRDDVVGMLLMDPAIIEALENRIKNVRGDAYDAGEVARKALATLGTTLDKLQQQDVTRLQSALLQAAEDAVGDLAEINVQDTRFAAHDLLVAKCRDQSELEAQLKNAVDKGAPFIQLLPSPPSGGWQPGGAFPAGLLETKGVGLRGGFNVNDLDAERVRVLNSLQQIGWNQNEIVSISDSSQIVFVEECGGFPLRAIDGLDKMKNAYDLHRQAKGNPLHIVRDEMAERFADIFPPDPHALEQAFTLQLIGTALELIAPRQFSNQGDPQHPLTLWAYLCQTTLTKEEKLVPLGDTPGAVVMNLAFNTALAVEINKELQRGVESSGAEKKAAIALKLKEFLARRKAELSEDQAIAPEANPIYVRERECIEQFAREYNLS